MDHSVRVLCLRWPCSTRDHERRLTKRSISHAALVLLVFQIGAASGWMGEYDRTCWGLPILPRATAVQKAGLGCAYQVDELPDRAYADYSEMLRHAGWRGRLESSSPSGMFGGPTVTAEFLRGTERIAIVLTFSEAERATLILVTRLSE